MDILRQGWMEACNKSSGVCSKYAVVKLQCVYIYISETPAEDPPGDVWSRANLDGELTEIVRTAAARGHYPADPLLPFDAAPSKEVFERYKAELLASMDGQSPKGSKNQESPST